MLNNDMQQVWNHSAKVTTTARNQALNLVWLSPKFAEPEAAYTQPIPDATIQNILTVCANNPNTDVRIWSDSRRLTSSQIDFLKELEKKPSQRNLTICDFRKIPRYASEPLFNNPDTSTDWRINKHSLIWRQVDAARILACFDGIYHQSFYIDADVTNFEVASPDVQSKISKHGVILAGGVSSAGYAWYENQMFGFQAEQRAFFEALYRRTIIDPYQKKENGYGVYIDCINYDLKGQQGIDTKEIVFQLRHDGTVAYHLDQNLV